MKFLDFIEANEWNPVFRGASLSKDVRNGAAVYYNQKDSIDLYSPQALITDELNTEVEFLNFRNKPFVKRGGVTENIYDRTGNKKRISISVTTQRLPKSSWVYPAGGGPLAGQEVLLTVTQAGYKYWTYCLNNPNGLQKMGADARPNYLPGTTSTYLRSGLLNGENEVFVFFYR